MLGYINPYLRQLSADEIAAGQHRHAVGGMWDEIGRLQFDFLVARGLRPSTALLMSAVGHCAAGFTSSRISDPAIITAWISTNRSSTPASWS